MSKSSRSKIEQAAEQRIAVVRATLESLETNHIFSVGDICFTLSGTYEFLRLEVLAVRDGGSTVLIIPIQEGRPPILLPSQKVYHEDIYEKTWSEVTVEAGPSMQAHTVQ